MARKTSAKNSLVANISKRKRAGISRPRSQSTISKAAYEEMQKGWPNAAAKKPTSGKKGRRTATKTAPARKRTA